MINLNAYDVLEPNIKYWIWIPRKIMYLKELKSRKYYSFLYRFNNEDKDYDYYLLLTDKETQNKDIKLHRLNKTTKGVFKIYLDSIWEQLKIQCDKTNLKINVFLEESNSKEELYKLDFN